jgi:hypothetical protein
MTERILIEGSVDPPLLGQVHALANGIKRVGEESEKLAGAAASGTRQLGEETAKAAQSTDRLGVSLRGVGEAARHLNEIRSAAVAFGEAALGAVRGVAELAGEQQRLNANSARLRLDFAQAARGAGGFATEMQTMQLATNLANRNIRVTQSELDTLARVGMARARDAGQEVDEVFETIADSIVEGGEELGKFGQELLTVADDSHTATDRLSALVRTGRSVAPTMRTAADEVAAFESSLRSAGRYISTGFVEETARLSQLTGQTRGIRTDAEEARRELEAMGRAAAFVLRGVADLAGIVVGAVAVSVRGLTGMMQGVAEAVRTRSFGGLHTGTAGAADDIRQTLAFINARVASLGALSADAGPRTTRTAAEAASDDAAAAAGNPLNSIVVTSQELGQDPITGRRITPANDNAGGGGTTRSDARMTEIDARLASVRQMTATEREARYGVKVATVAGIITRTEDEVLRVHEERVAALRSQMTERRAGESANDRRQRIAQLETQVGEAQQEIRAEASRRATEGVRGFVAAQGPAREQYQARVREIADLTRQQETTDQAVRDREAAAQAEAFARSPAGQEHAAAQMRADLEREHSQGAAMERERAQTEERLRVQESFTEQWERLHRRQASATTAMVDVANGAITTFGQALGKHVNLVLTGQESIGEGALNMMGEVVTAIGQEAIVKSAMELAEGIAAAAGVFTAPLAPGHFAAAGAFAAVGVAAIGAGALVTAARGGGGGASTPATPALPPPTQQEAAASEGGRNITIVYGSGILGSPRELARHIRDVVEEGAQGGIMLPARVVERAA